MKTMRTLLTSVVLCAGLLFASGAAQAVLIDRGGGLIYDTGLNITWLKDANFAKTSGYDADGAMNWPDAMTWTGNLSYGGYTDWRLPTIWEMNGLFVSLGGIPGATAANLSLFTNVQSPYWSSTENFSWGGVDIYAFVGGTYSGYGSSPPGAMLIGASKSSLRFTWAVRPGDVVAVPSPLSTPTKLPLSAALPLCPPTTKVDAKCGLVLVVHGWNANSEDWPERMVASIKSSITVDNTRGIVWAVGALDWGVEASAIDYRPDNIINLPMKAYANAEAIGIDLAKKIAAGKYDYVHLIAHSAGANVIQVATEKLKIRTDIKQPKIHLTFLDAYHPNNTLPLYDFSNYGKDADYAEHYVDRSILPTVFGTDTVLRKAFNFDITNWSPRPACFPLDFPCVHRWPYEWYQDSVNFSSSATPYKFGYSLSIESGNLSLPGYFKPGDVCTLENAASYCPPTNLQLISDISEFVAQEVITTTSGLVKNTYKSATGVVSSAVNGVISLFSGSPVWVTLELDLPMAISGLQFDYQFGGTGEGLLTVYLDDQRVYAADQRNGTGVQKSAGPFAIGAVSAGKHFLSFRLDNFDGPPISVDLSAITIGSFALAPVLNESPIAVAGEYRTVRVKSNVTLDGSASHDSESVTLSFQWQQVAGAVVTLTSPIAERPVFTPLAPGQYVFNLSVNDGLVDSHPASVVITVPALGDIDADGDVDTDDLAKITAALNQAANGPNDLRDIDGDGKITALDARKLVTLCTRPRCATR